jgi:lysophospholipase L1-like esterase
MLVIQKQQTVLFQGDSITDCGRSRDEQGANAGLGVGYAMMTAAELLRQRPGDGLRFLNRGISGNRVVDLYARWKIDAINLKPDIISILIGVNDTWHEFANRNGVELDRYETVYRMLLDLTRTRLPGTTLVLCEPFVLKCGVVTDAWIAEMDERRAVVRRLATEFRALFVPFQSMFGGMLTAAPPAYWATDGVHPTLAGHRLMAETWIATVARD